MKQGFIIIALAIFSITGYTQKAVIKSLQIGDTIPDVVIHNITHYSTTSARISDFKGKLLILDFWDMFCAVCIANMPHMEELQKTFGDKVQVLLVTQDSKEKVKPLSQQRPPVRNAYAYLPSVIADTILHQLFPHRTVPLIVWIDEKGVVRQKTSFNSFTNKDVQAFLDGKKVSLETRNDLMDLDLTVPLLLEGNGRQVKYIQYHSFLTKRIPEIATAKTIIGYDSIIGKPNRITYINYPMQELCKSAFRNSNWKWSFTVWDVIDSSKYFPPADKSLQHSWYIDHIYSYELQVPVENSFQLYAIMQEDMDRYFDLTGSIEKRKVKCWVLTRTTNSDSLFRANKEGEPFLSRGDNLDTITLHKQDIGTLIRSLSGDLELGIFDETHYTGLIDLGIPYKQGTHDYTATRKALLRYGLDLREEYKLLDCLVLKENGFINKQLTR